MRKTTFSIECFRYFFCSANDDIASISLVEIPLYDNPHFFTLCPELIFSHYTTPRNTITSFFPFHVDGVFSRASFAMVFLVQADSLSVLTNHQISQNSTSSYKPL